MAFAVFHELVRTYEHCDDDDNDNADDDAMGRMCDSVCAWSFCVHQPVKRTANRARMGHARSYARAHGQQRAFSYGCMDNDDDGNAADAAGRWRASSKAHDRAHRIREMPLIGTGNG